MPCSDCKPSIACDRCGHTPDLIDVLAKRYRDRKRRERERSARLDRAIERGGNLREPSRRGRPSIIADLSRAGWAVARGSGDRTLVVSRGKQTATLNMGD